ncbi:MAG: hypothetical protein IPI06_13505 [Gammaproteobacteria bacterium]|nr:hypothetical protein [Gammaproteobacteria bacterium]
MPGRWVVALMLLAAVPATSSAAARDFRILHYERMERIVPAGRGHDFSFDAYGRHFDLELEPNERLRGATRGRAPGEAEPLRGRVTGAARSWARITRTPAGLYGMIFDGNDLYAVEPAREAERFAVAPLPALRADSPVIYRLADALMPADAASCAAAVPAGEAERPPAQATALQAYEALSQELQTAAVTLAPLRQIEVAAVGDYEFSLVTTADGLTPEAAVIARMNVVDGLFTAQIGVKVLLADLMIFRTASDPFSDTRDPNTLLTELANWRQATPSQTARGLTHLLTGRNLSGTTVGIAYVGTICRARSGAALTQGTLSPTNAALVIAHEMGHNFGAPHDGEAGSACRSTPQTFLMAPRLNGSQTFSQCSLEQMAPVIAAANCLTPASVADAALDAPPPVGRPLSDRRFTYSFNVESAGTLAVDSVELVAQLPASLELDSASVNGTASCANGADNTVTCTLGTLAPGASRTITLGLTPRASGTSTLILSLSATNDMVAGNNRGQVSFEVDPSADLSVSLDAAAQALLVRESVVVTATVTNRGAAAVGDGLLTVRLPAGLSADSAGANALGCALQNAAVTCQPTALAPGVSQVVSFTVTGQQAGLQEISASIASAQLGDPVTDNNDARLPLDVSAPGAVSSAGSGGAAAKSGGGGALSGKTLLALLLIALWRRRAPVLRDLDARSPDLVGIPARGRRGSRNVSRACESGVLVGRIEPYETGDAVLHRRIARGFSCLHGSP